MIKAVILNSNLYFLKDWEFYSFHFEMFVYRQEHEWLEIMFSLNDTGL